MSLIEPLLPKEEVDVQKLETYSLDPLANLEKSIEKLSVDFESFELDSTGDIEFRDEPRYDEKRLLNKLWRFDEKDIECATFFSTNLVIGRIDGIIKIYKLDTKEEITLKGHTRAITCLQTHKDWYFLVSGSRDKTIIVWSLKNYQKERVFQAKNWVFCLELTINFDLFSGSLSEDCIRKWNFRDENEDCITILEGLKYGVTCMKSSHNNYYLVAGSSEGILKIWHIEDNKELEIRIYHKGPIDSIIITNDDKYIIFCSDECYIIIYDLESRQKIQTLDSKYNKAMFLDVTYENLCVWSKDKSNLLQSYGIEKNEYNELKDNITAMTCSKFNNLAFYGRDNNTAVIFDLKTFLPITVLNDFSSKIYKMLLVGPNDRYLASIMENGKIKIHKIYQENEPDIFTAQCSIADNRVKLSRDQKYLVIFDFNLLKIWNLIEKKDIFSYNCATLLDVQITNDNKYFLIGDSREKVIFMYSFQDMKEVFKFQVRGIKFSCFAISNDSRFAVTGKLDNDGHWVIEAFDIENKCKACTLESGTSEIILLKISKNNESLVSADTSHNLCFWSFSEKKMTNSFKLDSWIDYLKLNEKYNCVVVGMKNLIEIWNFQEKRKMLTIQESEYPLSCVEISEDEKYLIYAQNNEARIWSFEYTKEVDTIINDSKIYNNALDITRDYKYIVFGDRNINAKLWSCEEKRFIATIHLSGLGDCYAKFTEDGKNIIVYGIYGAQIHNIEDYVNCDRLDSNPYFIPGKYDRIVRQRFVNWIKKPTKELWNKDFLDVIVYPIGYNIFHSLCITDSVDLLSTALKDGGEIFRDKQNMSPLSYALARSSRRCIDEILNYAINLEDGRKQLYFIHQLRDDIPLLFNTKSLSLVLFLEVLFRRRPDKDQIGFYEVTENLPMSIFSPVSRIYTNAFTGENEIAKKDSTKHKENVVQFWGSPLGYNYAAGSDESLLILKKMDECESQEIFQTLFIQSIIREKWDYLWPAIMTISVIYWLNLITMTWYLFDSSIYILIAFAALNGILSLYEFLQFSTKPNDYVSEIWNLVDFFRMVLSIIWAVFNFYNQNIKELTFAVVFFNFFRGLTYFRAFDSTRFYVRLILMALSDSFAFLVIFLYSTLAFGVLYASLDIDLSFSGMWTMAYELNMGNFENDGFSFLQYSCFTLATLVNVVMMLNLLVSTLGDTFDKFQMITDELDTKEMLQLVLEFESIMFWARSEQAKLINKDKLMYLQRCDIFQDNDVPDKWQGKIKEISIKIDGVKDDILGSKRSVREELKKLEENFEKIIDEKIKNSQNTVNEKIENCINEKIGILEEKMESKINNMMEMLEMIKTKLEISQ